MKYGYIGIGVHESELIQNYEILDNKIIITYLDGSKKEEPFTKKNEKKLLCKMLKQAKDRSKSLELNNIKKVREERIFSDVLTETGLGSLLLTNLIYQNNPGNIRDLSIIIAGLGFSAIAVTSILSYKSKSDKIKELEKYDIYLAIRKQLENSTDPNLFDGVKSKEKILNINTLDHYSLNDLKKIRDNLTEDIKNSVASKESDITTFTKKISK